MKIYATNKEDRLSEVQDLYSAASIFAEKKKTDFANYDAQYRGKGDIDGYIETQSGEQIKAKAATAVWNLSHKLLEGSIDTNIPQPLVTPELKCEHHVRNARRIENLIKMLLDKQPWEVYNDQQERTVKKFGTSGSNVEWDVDSGTHTTVGEAQITPLRPQNIYPQPGITSIEDADYVFINYITTRAELMRRYSLTEEDLEGSELESVLETNGDSEKPTNNEDVVTLTVMWYLNEYGDICRYAFSGDLVLEDDDDYYSRRVEYCKNCGRRRQICEKDECTNPDYYTNKMDYDVLEEDIRCSDGRVIPKMSPVFKDGKPVFETVRMPVTAPDGSQVMDDVGGVPLPAYMEVQVPKMEKTRLPYYKPKKLPVAIRYNIRDDKSFWGISDMEILRGPQQEANKLFSRIMEAVMKYGAALMLPEEAEFEASNGVFDDIIRLTKSMTKDQFGVFSYQVDISSWLVMLDKVLELASDLSGVTDAYLGAPDSTAKSGYAKALSINQASGRMASRKVNKHAHFADIFRIIFELYLAFADEPRAINHDDSDCALAAEERFNRFDFYEYDYVSGNWHVDDNYSFSVDPNGALSQQYMQMWEVVKADFASGMYGDTASIDTQIATWQHLEKLKYPFARNIVEIKKAQREQMIQAQQAAQKPTAANGMPPQASDAAMAVKGATTPEATASAGEVVKERTEIK